MCYELRQVAPNCLKANLILSQILFASNRQEAAGPLLDAATAVDPENLEAAELYAWLAVRSESLVPIHSRVVSIEGPERDPIPTQVALTQPFLLAAQERVWTWPSSAAADVVGEELALETVGMAAVDELAAGLAATEHPTDASKAASPAQPHLPDAEGILATRAWSRRPG